MSKPDETTRKPKRSVLCEQCNMRPVMDRCAICEECWYSSDYHFDGDVKVYHSWEAYYDV